jgi:hypothetical protein
MAKQTDRIDAGVAERGRAVIENARDKAGDVLESARGEAGNLQAALADRLEAGAERIRTRSRPGRAYRGSGASDAEQRAEEANLAVAERMDRGAMWLREHDLSDVGYLVRRELRERPGRVALVALGLGILIGRASRRR